MIRENKVDDTVSTESETRKVFDSKESDSNYVSAAKGSSILFFGRLFDFASRFIFGVLVARSLGAEGLGLYMLGVTTVVAIATFARLGLSEGMVHFLPEALDRRDDDRVWGILQIGLAVPALIGLALGLLVFGLAGFLAEELFNEPDMAPVLRLISIAIPMMAVGRALMAATRGFKVMRYEVLAGDIIFSVSRLALTMLLLALGWGLNGALMAYIIGWVITVVAVFFFLNRLFPLRRPINTARRDSRRLLSFSLPISVSQVVMQLRGTFEILMLGIFGTAAAVGIYSAAGRIMVIGGFFLAAVEMVAKPIISELYHREDQIQLGKLYKTLTRWSLAFVLPYVATVVIFAAPILAIFGEEFEEGAIVILIISVGTLVNALTGICGSVVVMTGHSKLELFNSILAVLTSVTLSAVLIPQFGMIGAAVAVAASLTLINIMRLVEVYWLHRLWPYGWTLAKPVLAVAVAVLVGYMMNKLLPAEQNFFFLILDIALLWLAYFAAIMLLGLSEEDRLVLGHVKGRLNQRVVRRLGQAIGR